jgi:O-antigen/teichoic acid export membrane protein
MRYSLVVVALLASTLAARPDATLRLFYKAEYAVGATALMALLAGYVCFSLFNIAGTILNGAGHTKATTIIGVSALAVSVIANYSAISWALASGRDPLLWAGLSTAVAMGVGLVLSGLFLLRHFGAFLPPLSLVRVAASSACAFAVGHFWPTTGFLGGKLGTLISMSACGLTFLVIAIGSGELRPAELKRLRKA